MTLCFTSTAAEETAGEQPVSIELLEFLGEWSTDEGEWLDPMSLEDETLTMEFDKPESQQEETDE